MDLGLTTDMFDSFLEYQTRMAAQFQRLRETYGFTIVNGARSADDVNAELQAQIESVLAGS